MSTDFQQITHRALFSRTKSTDATDITLRHTLDIVRMSRFCGARFAIAPD